jgi:eukaryotic-like serine/threonine-protein kinase
VNTLLDGRYQIIKKLGHGGFAHTYLARNISLPHSPTCVIKHLRPKFLHPSMLQLFKKEARVLGQLDHQQIPSSSECFEKNGEMFMVQDFIEGEDLGKQYLRGQKWSEAQVRGLLADLLAILSYVHQNQIVHRDIKPENIIQRQRDGRYVLIDFGAVQELGSSEEEKGMGAPILGTAGYRSPEQLQGESVCSSDLYGLGVTAIHLLTRTHPKCLDRTYDQLIWQDRATVSREMAKFLDKMICPNLADRYLSATIALADLQSLPAAPPEMSTSKPDEANPSVSRKGMWLALLGAVGIATALWGINTQFSNPVDPKLQQELLHS